MDQITQYFVSVEVFDWLLSLIWHVALGTWSRYNSPDFFILVMKYWRRLVCTVLSRIGKN